MASVLGGDATCLLPFGWEALDPRRWREVRRVAADGGYSLAASSLVICHAITERIRTLEHAIDRQRAEFRDLETALVIIEDINDLLPTSELPH